MSVLINALIRLGLLGKDLVTVQAFQTVASRRDRVLGASGSSEGGG